MSKAKLSNETLHVLDDLENRIVQLIEVNARAKDGDYRALVENQETAFQSVLTLIDQIKTTGKVMRGNDYVPDSIEPLATTKWLPQTKLI